VERLREMMEEVDNAVTAFKEEQRIIYEELVKEEKTTVIELNALEKKIEASFRAVAEKSFKVPSGNAQVDNMACSQLPEDVVAFEKFLQQTGGRLGGWDDFDHQSFLKIWTRHKGRPSYLEEALTYIPSRTREDVEQHENWYKEFLFLEEKKKDSIQKWKAKKQEEKIEVSKVQDKIHEISEFDQKQQEETQRQKLEEERRKRHQELKAWKRQKEIEAAAKLEAKLKEEEEHQRKQRKERQRQLEVKLVVEEKYQDQEGARRLSKTRERDKGGSRERRAKKNGCL
ncbi:unnamed protein product, partial [Ranitomeya imitator]